MSTDSSTPEIPDPGDGHGMIHVQATSDGLAIVDPIERQRDDFRTASSLDPTRVDPGGVPAPVDVAMAVDVTDLALTRLVVVVVRDPDWTTAEQVEEGDSTRFDPGEYVIEVLGPIKIYLHVEGAFGVTNDEETRFEFDPETSVTVAARSKHSRPAATVETTGDPEDVMAAVSTFGAALKTYSPERSWPTLRGHPPAVEYGDELAIPDDLEPPDTGTWIEVPRDLEYVFPVAPLAYYLGAEVRPGPVPRLRTDRGLDVRLDAGTAFETGVARILKRVLFLECLTRVDGLYGFDLHERAILGDEIDLDWPAVYDLPSADRLERYLDVPHDLVVDHLPQWNVAAYLPPEPDQAEVLPYLLDDLAVVRTHPEPERGAASLPDRDPPEAVDSFLRSGVTRTATDDAAAGGPYVQLDGVGALGTVWNGDATPVNATKSTTRAYRHVVDRDPVDPPIDVAVVCNDSEMQEEVEDVDDVYGTDTSLPFDVRTYSDLTTAGLETLIADSGIDFLHYVGHATREGLECTDGNLDLRTVSDTDIEAFVLNACRSYQQGLALVEAGAVSGIATRQTVGNAGAVGIGRVVARLLNAGYSVNAALDVASDGVEIGSHYVVLGDGNHCIAHRPNDAQLYYQLDSVGEGIFEMSIRAYGTGMALGSVFTIYHDNLDYFLTGKETPRIRVTCDEFDEVRGNTQSPVRVDGNLHWIDRLSEKIDSA